jgi:hypothetical protein
VAWLLHAISAPCKNLAAANDADRGSSRGEMFVWMPNARCIQVKQPRTKRGRPQTCQQDLHVVIDFRVRSKLRTSFCGANSPKHCREDADNYMRLVEPHKWLWWEGEQRAKADVGPNVRPQASSRNTLQWRSGGSLTQGMIEMRAWWAAGKTGWDRLR